MNHCRPPQIRLLEPVVVQSRQGKNRHKPLTAKALFLPTVAFGGTSIDSPARNEGLRKQVATIAAQHVECIRILIECKACYQLWSIQANHIRRKWVPVPATARGDACTEVRVGECCCRQTHSPRLLPLVNSYGHHIGAIHRSREACGRDRA